ncbi:MAG: hypothetical protein AseanaTS_18610 [Candidatus Pelagadaptatus aseana]
MQQIIVICAKDVGINVARCQRVFVLGATQLIDTGYRATEAQHLPSHGIGGRQIDGQARNGGHLCCNTTIDGNTQIAIDITTDCKGYAVGFIRCIGLAISIQCPETDDDVLAGVIGQTAEIIFRINRVAIAAIAIKTDLTFANHRMAGQLIAVFTGNARLTRRGWIQLNYIGIIQTVGAGARGGGNQIPGNSAIFGDFVDIISQTALDIVYILDHYFVAQSIEHFNGTVCLNSKVQTLGDRGKIQRNRSGLAICNHQRRQPVIIKDVVHHAAATDNFFNLGNTANAIGSHRHIKITGIESKGHIGCGLREIHCIQSTFAGALSNGGASQIITGEQIGIITFAALQTVTGGGVQTIITFATLERIAASTTVEFVVTFTAIEGIGTTNAIDFVVPGTTQQCVGGRVTADQGVITQTAVGRELFARGIDNMVVIFTTGHQIVAVNQGGATDFGHVDVIEVDTLKGHPAVVGILYTAGLIESKCQSISLLCGGVINHHITIEIAGKLKIIIGIGIRAGTGR